MNKTYNVVFNDQTNSNDLGFTISLSDAKNYIQTYNGTNKSYFEGYKGGIVSIVCNETDEIVFETEVV
jgi:hypothetical protein